MLAPLFRRKEADIRLCLLNDRGLHLIQWSDDAALDVDGGRATGDPVLILCQYPPVQAKPLIREDTPAHPVPSDPTGTWLGSGVVA